jgi:hypothetical protein
MTADRIPALLEPIQNRLNAVTPGPWEWEGNDIVRTESNWTTVLESEVSCMSYCYGGSVAQVIKPEDRVFIANAPTDQARLLAAVQAVVVECAAIEDETGNLGLDLQDDDFDRGWARARREAVERISSAVVAALGGEG